MIKNGEKLFAIALGVFVSFITPKWTWANECNKKTLIETYATMLRSDQNLRYKYNDIKELEYRKLPFDEKEKEKIEEKIPEIDKKNQIMLNKLIKRCGWPGELDNKQATLTAFIVVQHADLDFQLKYYRLLKSANLRGEISNAFFALLEDRMLLRQEKLQKYGTQFVKKEDGTNVVAPVEDSDNLNRRRRDMGLDPLDGFPR